MKWSIGCSGFSYKHWKPGFYPEDLPSTKWFEFYNEHFDTVELNVTFYRFPTAKTFAGWYKRSAPDFTFSVKAPKLITHYKQLIDCGEKLSQFYTACSQGLGDKLGPILFQFPPKFSYTPERVQRMIDGFNPAYTNVVEFRHNSWWNTKVYALLKKHHITFCSMSHPQLPGQLVAGGGLVYYRFHGVPDLYASLYSDAEMERIASSISTAKGIKKAWCYFNNDINVSAIKNAEWLQQYSRR